MVANIEEDEVVEVEMPRREILKAFSMFHERGIICFFTRKNPLVHWVVQWLNAIVGRNNVEDVYKGPRGFFESCPLTISITLEYNPLMTLA